MKKLLFVHALALAVLTFLLIPTASGTMYSTIVSNDHPYLYWNFDDASGNSPQLMPLTAPVGITNNDLYPLHGQAPRISHASMGDGLRLGNALDIQRTNCMANAGFWIGTTDLSNAPYAVEFWMQATGTNQNAYMIHFGTMSPREEGGNHNAPSFIYNYQTSLGYPGMLEMYANNGRTTTNALSVTDANWHYVLWVNFGDGRINIYVDSTLKVNVSGGGIGFVGKDLSLWNDMCVGAALPTDFAGFPGRMDELAIYSLTNLTSEAAVSDQAYYLMTNHMAQAQIGASAPSYASVVLADNPLLYYNFDEPSGIAYQQAPIFPVLPDNSQNNLIANGTAAPIAHADLGDGLDLGSGIDLDGSTAQYASINQLVLGRGTLEGKWAVEFWFQLKTNLTTMWFMDMGGRSIPSLAVSAGYYYPSVITDQPTPNLLEAYGGGSGGRSGASGGIPFYDNNWHHLILINYDTSIALSAAPTNNLCDMFLDAVYYPNVGGTSGSFNTPMDFAGLYFGGQTRNSASGALNGRLDELAIYDLNYGYTNDAQITAAMGAMASNHYAAAFDAVSYGTITIHTQPTSVVSGVGQVATFTVAATVSGTSNPLTYEWLRNGMAIPGATNSTYNQTNTLYDIGTNTFQVKLAAPPATASSLQVTLAVASPPAGPLSAYSQHVLANNPFLYWNFDEFSGPALEIANTPQKPITTENDLQPINAATRVSHSSLADGLSKLGNAMVCDGVSACFSVTNSSMRTGTNATSARFAIEYWMQLQTTNPPAQLYTLDFQNSVAILFGYQPTIPLNMELYGSSGRSGTNGPVFPSDFNWHHIVWVNYNTSPNHGDCYIDGVLYPNVGGTFNNGISLAKYLSFGASGNTGHNDVPANFDSLAIYDFGALTATQLTNKMSTMVTNHFAVAYGGPANYDATVLADGATLYYNFDEASGSARQLVPIPTSSLPAINDSVNKLNPSGFMPGRVQHSVLNDGLNLGNAADLNGRADFAGSGLNVGFGITSLPAPWAVEFWMQSEAVNASAYMIDFGSTLPAFTFNYAGSGVDYLQAGINFTANNSPAISDNNWHHIMWVFYGDGISGVADDTDVYVDGALTTNVRSSFTSPLTLSGNLIAGGASTSANTFQGRIDELAIYDMSTVGSQAAIANQVSNMVADHFSTAMTPSLGVSLSGGKLSFSWPFGSYLLQQNTALNNPAGWTNVPGGATSPVLITPPAGGSMFYRLKHQ